MRIGIVTGEYPPMQGGVGDFSREIGKALAEIGHQVHILAPAGSQPTDLPANCTLDPLINRWGWSLARRIRRWVKDNRLEIVNLQYQAAAFNMHPAVNILPGRLAGAPLVVTFHDLNVPYLFPKAGALRWGAILRLAQKAAAVIVTNRQDELTLQQYRSVSRLTVIPIGSNINPCPPVDFSRDEWRGRLRVLSSETLIGFFGFLNASKGGEDLVETLYRLRKRGIPAKLLLIGGRTGSSDPTNIAYAEMIDDLIAQRRLQQDLIRTGYVSPAEVSASLYACDLCLLPFRDGVSFRRGSFMAALAHNMPIISTTPAVEIPELVHRQNVYLAPAAAPVAYTEAVVTIQNDTALRNRLGYGASQLAQSFQWGTIAHRTADLFDTVKRKR